jgi:hypothetical protein
MELEREWRTPEVGTVHEGPDLILAACCAASLILVPLFVIAVTLTLLSIAIAGEIADRLRIEEAR